MKKILYKLVILVVFLTTSSCADDFLDVVPKDQLSSGSFFANETDAIQAVTGVYNRWTAQDFFLYYLIADGWSDNATPVFVPGDPRRIGAGGHTSGTGDIRRMWRFNYSVIRRANVFLANIENVPSIDSDLKSRLIAEVKFLRSLAYFYLVYNWGDVPLTTEPLALSETKIPRTPKNEVVNFMLTELAAAAQDLPVSYTGNNVGRVTEGAARGLIARIQLYEGNWSEAVTAAQQVMGLGYSLYQGTGGEGYSQLFHSANDNNDEVLFDIQFQDEEITHFWNVVFLPPTFSGWGGLSPIKNFVDSFEAGDPRLEMAVLQNGQTFRGSVLSTIDASTSDGIGVTGNSTRSGYYVHKALDPDFSGAAVTSHNNLIIIRYAEILLTFAEAQNEASGPSGPVYDAIDELRTRAGLPVVDRVAISTQDALRDLIRQERRSELCFESTRIYDIRRWRTAENVMNGPIFDATDSEIETRVFNAGTHYLWPIPQNDIDLIGPDILTQNPGY